MSSRLLQPKSHTVSTTLGKTACYISILSIMSTQRTYDSYHLLLLCSLSLSCRFINHFYRYENASLRTLYLGGPVSIQVALMGSSSCVTTNHHVSRLMFTYCTSSITSVESHLRMSSLDAKTCFFFLFL